MKLNAQNVDYFIWLLKGDGWSTKPLDDNSKNLLMKLFDVADVIAPMGDDDEKIFWIRVPRGPFKEYVRINYSFDNEYKEEKLRKSFEEDYPDKYKWYKIVLVRHKSYVNDGEFLGVFMADKFLLSINNPNEDGWPIDVSTFIEGLIVSVNDVIAQLKENKYNDRVKKNLPAKYKYGRIKRKDYYDIYPDLRKEYLREIGKDVLNEFLEYVEKNDVEADPSDFLNNMTARVFYEACSIAYDAAGYEDRSKWKFTDSDEEHERYGGTTPKEKYYMHADGRDNGLINVPMDDPKEFKLWFNEKGDYYEFNGSHPYEIRTAGSIRYSIHLFPHHNKEDDLEGYFFILSGDSYHTSFETIKMFLALIKSGFPVVFSNAKEVASRFMEMDDIGVLPYTIPSWYAKYGNSHIGKDVMDFVNLYDGDKAQEVIAKTRWMDEAEVTLKE